MLATAAAIFSALLIVTGLAKLVRPHDVQRALAAFGFPRIPGVGLMIGFVEVAVGAGALVIPEALWTQAAMYSVFAIWVTMALRLKVPIASCGCLGRPDTPPTAFHVFLDLIAAVVSLGAAAGPPLAIESGMAAVAQVVVIVIGVVLSYVVLTDLAFLAGVRRR